MTTTYSRRSIKVAAEQRPLEEQVAEENEAFQTDAAFDLSSRERFKEGMKEPQTYTVEEDAIVAEGKRLRFWDRSGLRHRSRQLLVNTTHFHRRYDSDKTRSLNC